MDCTYKVTDMEWGDVPIRLSVRAKRVIFKIEQGALCIVVPTRMAIDERYLLQLIDAHRVALRRMVGRAVFHNSQARLYSGKVIKTLEGEIHILADDKLERNCVRSLRQGNCLYVYYSSENDIAEPRYEQFVSQFIVGRMRAMWGGVLCRMVLDCATQHSLSVADVRVGRGRRTLGHCSRKGVITISAYVLFYPLHLRHFIVYHELAHLTHFNHSDDFHRLCNSYCQGCEQQWKKESDAFVFPVL